ncbi:MAG TPA: DUF2155 domain-containing protein [Acetobacteraceae bacterium]|nr:DUF2155 domain-containing protein [Acetobacteraceae bacterium]
MTGRGLALVMAVGLPVAALAQGMAPITATPLLPPTGTAPQTVPNVAAVPQPTDQTQPPATQPSVQQGATPTSPGDAPSTAVAPAAPQPMQLTWVPQGAAQVQVLDKVNAQNTVLTLKVGQQAQYESLTIQVTACSIHPPDRPQDAAAYLKITDSHADAPGFQGWMLATHPSASMLENPIYDVRVVGCQA